MVVRYQPPAGLSPAGIRYLSTFRCDGRTFVAILAQLAAHKLLSIIPAKAVILTKLRDERHLARQLREEEKLVFKNLFEWQETVELGTPEPRLLEKIQKSLHAQLSQYVTRNFTYIILGLVLTGAATAWMCLSLRLFGNDAFDAPVMSAFTGLTVAIFALFTIHFWEGNLQAVKLALRGLYHRRLLLFLAVVILLFPAIWYLLLHTVAPAFANVTGMLILVNMLAAPCLRSYTAAGWQLLSQIQGFRQFMEAAEQDRLQRLNPPSQPMQAGEEFLPYAIALDVREDWGDQLGIRAMVETVL